MTNFRLLKRTRQTTEYSCGASALQSVLAYWGKDVDEQELMKLMGTTEEEGTYPEMIAKAARALGFEADVKDNLTLDEVQTFTASGHPMIALAQVWRSAKANRAVEDEWDAGHYISVIGVDKDNVYFQDPYVRNCKAFVPRKSFEEHWRQIMGGIAKQGVNPKLMRLGIFIRGKKPAPVNLAEEVKLASLNFAKFGSLNLIVAKFAGQILPLDMLEEMKALLDPNSVRANAFIFLRKDKEGRLSGMEGSGLQEATDTVEFNALVTAVTSRMVEGHDSATTAAKAQKAAQAAAQGDFGLSSDALHAIAERLPAGQSAFIVFFENLWERKFNEILAKNGGEVINQRQITPQALARAAQGLVAESYCVRER